MLSSFVNPLPEPNCELAATCVMASKNLSGLELELAMAEIALDYVDQLKYVPEPQAPLVLVRFRVDCKSYDWTNKGEDEKKSIRKRLFKRGEVQDYLDNFNKASMQNKVNAEQLEEYIRIWLELNEPERGKKCWDIYQGYPDKVVSGRVVLWEKKKHFQER